MPQPNTNILTFRNLQQKILFDWELNGQLSDGYWENSMPRNHWEAWDCKTVVSDNGRVGRNFYVPKDNYNFASPTLLEVVGERMHRYCIFALAFGTVERFDAFFAPLKGQFSEDYIDALFDADFNVDVPNGTDDYFVRRRDAFLSLNLDQLSVDCQRVTYYTFADMKRDLEDMKTIIRTRI